MSIGFGVYLLSEDDLRKVVPVALRLGYRYFDTAIRYGNQKILAQLLREESKKLGINRSQIFVVSKVGHRCLGNLPKQIKKDVLLNPYNYTITDLKLDLEKDWKKIQDEVISQLEYLDLILLHRPYHQEINKEIWAKLVEIQKKNPRLIRNIGVSNFRKEELKQILPIQVPAYNQFEISPFSPRNELRQYCLEWKIKIIGHSSLAKMKFDLKKFPILDIISKKYQITIATLFLKWSYDQSIQIIPRTSCLKHLVENYQVQNLDFKLSKEDFQELKTVINGFLTHQEYQDN